MWAPVAVLFRVLSFCLMFSTSALAQSYTQSIQSLPKNHMLVIKGNNTSADNILLVIRIDDHESVDYYSRMNEERTLPVGAFELRFSVDSLKSSDKRALDAERLKALYLFEANDKDFQIESVQVAKIQRFPEHIIAYDFGGNSATGELLEGSRLVSPNNPNDLRLFGHLNAVDRPGPDPWIRDGIAGLDRIEVPIDQGIWRLVLFREDIGEWENLPRQRNLSFKVDGKTYSGDGGFDDPASWYQDNYLRFYHQEALTDPWRDIVQHRGHVQVVDVLHQGGSLEIELLGQTPQERFVSGLILERLDTHKKHVFLDGVRLHGLAVVNEARERYFKQHWYFEAQTASTRASDVPPLKDKDFNLLLAPEEHRTIKFDVDVKAGSYRQLDVLSGQSSIQEIRLSKEKWYRHGSMQKISKQKRHLSAIEIGHKLPPGSHEVLLRVGMKVGSDRERVHVRFTHHESSNGTADSIDNQGVDQNVRLDEYPDSLIDKHLDIRLTIEKIAQQLPSVQQTVGIYLDDAPHLNWFPSLKKLKLAQNYCDLKYLDRLGLNSLAPAFTEPTNTQLSYWQQQVNLYKRFGSAHSLMAYTPFKRLRQHFDSNELKTQIDRALSTQGLFTDIYWSIADEARPQDFDQITEDARLLHSANQIARTAGHLNNPNQEGLIKDLDLVLINHGYGIKKTTVRDIRNKKQHNGSSSKVVWLYNMPRFRLAAGLFLWMSEADGYVQWHGRMPTANPYDPTDGREGDYQFFPPEPMACKALPDIDKGLYQLAEGAEDLKWMHWLASQNSPDAVLLLAEIQQDLGSSWQYASRITDKEIDGWLLKIKLLAQSLK